MSSLIQDGRRLKIAQILKNPFLTNRHADFDGIWYGWSVVSAVSDLFIGWPLGRNWAKPVGSSQGQISHLPECGRVIYQIEGIDKATNRNRFLSKSGDYFFLDGRRKVKRSFFIMRFQIMIMFSGFCHVAALDQWKTITWARLANLRIPFTSSHIDYLHTWDNLKVNNNNEDYSQTLSFPGTA